MPDEDEVGPLPWAADSNPEHARALCEQLNTSSVFVSADIMTEEFGAAQTTAVLEQYPDAVRIPRPGVGAQAFSPREGLVTESVHSEL